MKEYKADAVIIGGGIAGITAAIDQVNEGQKVLVIDRDVLAECSSLIRLCSAGLV